MKHLFTLIAVLLVGTASGQSAKLSTVEIAKLAGKAVVYITTYDASGQPLAATLPPPDNTQLTNCDNNNETIYYRQLLSGWLRP